MKKKYFLGCSGFSYGHWVKKFYPKELPERKWLEFYAKHFNSVEINSSFYHFPKKKTLENWVKRTPEKFVFSLKMTGFVTHRKKFNGTKKVVKEFYEVSEVLEEKLGCILFQLPPSLKKNLKLLEKMARQMDFEKKNVVEFRHKSWFCEEVFKRMKELGLIFCVVSCPELPETVVETTKTAYFRFHGKAGWYDFNYPLRELRKWAEKMQKLKAKEVFAYFNNDSNAFAVKNCKKLGKLLS